MIKNVKEGTSGKDEAASTETKKSMTREEKRQAKIRNIEKKRLRREERKYGKTRRSKMAHGQKRILYHTLATSFIPYREQIFHS